MEVPNISPIALLRTLTIDRLRDDLPIVADDFFVTHDMISFQKYREDWGFCNQKYYHPTPRLRQ